MENTVSLVYKVKLLALYMCLTLKPEATISSQVAFTTGALFQLVVWEIINCDKLQSTSVKQNNKKHVPALGGSRVERITFKSENS